MRIATACANCRRRRRKCESEGYGSSCRHCSKKGLSCNRPTSFSAAATQLAATEYAGSGEVGENRALVSSANANQLQLKTFDLTLSPDGGFHERQEGRDRGDVSTLANLALQVDLVNLYFDYVHDQFHSLFHHPTFREDVKQRRAPLVIVYAMMALSARFSSHPAFADIDPQERGAPFVKQSEILFNPKDISLTMLQTAVLLGAYWTCEGDPSVESVYVCIACRMAQLLDLPSRPTSNLIQKEVNIRVWGTLCMIDVWSSAGVGIPAHLTRHPHAQLPMDDLVFLKLTPFDMESDLARIDPFSNRASSLITQMIKLNRILAEVDELNREAAAGRADDNRLEEAVDGLTRKLNDWLEALPEYMRDEPENLSRYRSIGLGRVFVAVYCGYYHYGQLLYYRFLHEESYSSVASVHSYSLRCKAHAAALCEIIYASHSTPDCDVLYNMVGHILVVASTVHLHILLFSPNDDEIKVARSRLERNFQILLHLQKFWPTLEVCLLRLRVFHEACRKSIRTSFKMDRWMIRFMSEFGRPVDDRTESLPENASWSWEGIGFSPQ